MEQIESGQALLERCAALGLPIWELARRQEAERSGQTLQEVDGQMARCLGAMRNSFIEPLEEPRPAPYRMIGGEGRLLRSHFEQGQSILGPLFSKIVYRSMAVLEQNASMGLIVAEPTAGSSGVLPGALFTLQEEFGLEEGSVMRGMYCAGAVGQLIMRNGTVSGAEAGCQAEVGAASAMAAAGAVEMFGGGPEACLDAAALALTNLLGLVCDPVAGLVQCPCQTRNALGAANGVLCGEMALAGMRSFIPFDQMVEALYDVGRRLPRELRETAQGGCAATPAGQAWKEKIFGGGEEA